MSTDTRRAGFVGRTPELATLVARLSAAAGGAGSVVLIGGDAGIGKSRLAEEAAAAAGELGVQVAWSRCADEAAAPALWPWTQVLARLGSARSAGGARIDTVPRPAEPGDEAGLVPDSDARRGWVETLPEATTTSIALLRLPPLPELPEPLRGRFAVHLRFAHLGSAAAGAALLAPMRAVSAPLMDMVGEMPYAAVDSIHMDPTDPMPVWERGATLRELPAEAVDALLAAAGPGVEVPLIMVEVRHLGGAIAHPAAVPNAVAGRDAAFSLFTLGPMAGPPAEVVPAITQSVIDLLTPWAARGSLLNFLGRAGPERVGRLWDDADRARLLAVKRALDPTGLFSHGHVIG